MPALNVQTTVDQLAVLVLKALDERVSATRADAIRFVANQGWFAIKGEDHAPYPSDLRRGYHEPRWKVALAWARNRAVTLKLLDNRDWNCWEILKSGRDELRAIELKFAAREWSACICFMWSPRFKMLMDPKNYTGGADDPRPGSVYKDMPRFWFGPTRERVNLVKLADLD